MQLVLLMEKQWQGFEIKQDNLALAVQLSDQLQFFQQDLRLNLFQF